MMDDRKIQTAVQEELSWEPSLDSAGVGVAVHDGVVTLTGEITTFGQKHRAETAVTRVRGVRGVANEMTVQLGTPHRKSDADLVDEVADALALNLAVPRERIKVVVRNGTVTLRGEVEWDYQRRAALRAVRDLPGVRGLVNEMKVRSHANPIDVKEKIGRAFHRSAQIDAEHVAVEVEGSKVTLRGTVSSWPERREAERAAWSAPGVTAVDNRLAVEARAALAF